MPRPDYSDYVAHFTKDAGPFGLAVHAEDKTLKAIAPTSAFDRLVSILKQRRIIATPMPWTGRRAVAYTECPWGSLIRHAERYSPYGVGFTKAHLFAAGGGPAIYLRQDLLDRQREYAEELSGQQAYPFHKDLWTFVTPFAPEYAPAAHLDTYWTARAPCDYTYEREWRVPHDFTFDYDEVMFVIVKSYEDVAKFPTSLKDAIGRERFLIMDVYHQIEQLWPLHIIE